MTVEIFDSVIATCASSVARLRAGGAIAITGGS